MKKLKVMTVFGTRPEAIKMAPLTAELGRRPEIESLCCVTAQHREMLDSVLNVFRIRPDFDLNIMQTGQTLSQITSRTITGMDAVLEQAQPDLVLVHGDTSTTFAGALSAFYHKVPVGHVEAGLRTYDRYSPYPEEMNRALTGRLAELHFAPTARNAENLRREAVQGEIFITGNTVIDALALSVRDVYVFEDARINEAVASGKRIVLMTAHRRENYGSPLENIMLAARQVAETFPDVTVIYPVHLSPVVRAAAEKHLAGVPGVLLTEPLNVLDMHNLMARSTLILTDSGGIQEEAPALGKPVLVLRRETERPEAVEAGTVRLAGVERENIFRLASELLTDETAYQAMARAVNPYGDGRASERIADAILWHFGRGAERPADFTI